MDKCPQCEEAKRENQPEFKAKNTVCFVCKKEVSEVLNLHHTNADLCSYECEKKYWLDIFYS